MPNRPRVELKRFRGKVIVWDKFVIFRDYGLGVCIDINERVAGKG
jgi:hypothetical protein